MFASLKRTLFGLKQPPGWTNTSAKRSGREGLTITHASLQYTITVHLCPRDEFGVDAVIVEPSVEQRPVGDSPPVPASQQNIVAKLALEFLTHNGYLARIDR